MADGNKVSFQSNTACLALHHHRVLSDMAKQSIISAATEKIFLIAWVQHPEDTDGNYDRRLALDHTKDFLSMMTGYESVMQKNINTDLNVYILQTSDYENIRYLPVISDIIFKVISM